MSEEYLDQYEGEKVTYDVPVSSFLPTITVCDSFWDTVYKKEIENCNNMDHWNVYFLQEGDEKEGRINAVDCKELIDSWEDI